MQSTFYPGVGWFGGGVRRRKPLREVQFSQTLGNLSLGPSLVFLLEHKMEALSKRKSGFLYKNESMPSLSLRISPRTGN